MVAIGVDEASVDEPVVVDLAVHIARVDQLVVRAVSRNATIIVDYNNAIGQSNRG